MRDENARAREKFDLSLDGRQIASIVVGALVILGVVFVLGLNVGRQIAVRQVEASRGGDLEALDRVPVAAAQPAKNDITFYDQLPKGRPAPPPPAEPKPAPAPVPASQAAPAPARPATPATSPSAPSTATAAPAGASPAAGDPPAPSPAKPTPAAAPASQLAAAAPPAPAPAHPATAPAASAHPPSGAFCIQLAATQSRAEADKIAARHRGLSPRVEAADVPGKGRFYRVRAGSFASRAEAERFLNDAARESGAKGFVTASK